MNKTFLKGRLTKDAEVRWTQGGKPVVSFSMATNERWLDQATNEWKERAEYHNVVLFDRHAKLFADGNNIQHLVKGASVSLEGKNQTRSWDGDNGQKRYTTEVVVDTKGDIDVVIHIKMASTQQQQYQPQQQPQQQYQPQQQPQQQQYQQQQQQGQPNYRDMSQSFAD